MDAIIEYEGKRYYPTAGCTVYKEGDLTFCKCGGFGVPFAVREIEDSEERNETELDREEAN